MIYIEDVWITIFTYCTLSNPSLASTVLCYLVVISIAPSSRNVNRMWMESLDEWFTRWNFLPIGTIIGPSMHK